MAFGDKFLKKKYKTKELEISTGGLGDALAQYMYTMKLFPEELDIKAIDFSEITKDTTKVVVYYDQIKERKEVSE